MKIVIIGASAGALGCINTLVRLGSTSDITCITSEEEPPYNKCLLADYLCGEKGLEQVYTRPLSFFEEHGINLMQATQATRIDRENKRVHVVHDGREDTVPYDKLLIATGVSPLVPPIEGLDSSNVLTFQTLADTEKLLAATRAKNIKSAIVIGAGLSGLECADGLHGNGIETTVIERESQVLPRQLTAESASFIKQRMVAGGISVHTGESVAHVSRVANKSVVHLSSGRSYTADLLVCAMGGRPNVELAQQAALELRSGAIATNDYLQTSDPNIFAVGDCAAVKMQQTGESTPSCTWPDAMSQGMHAALAILEKPKEYPGVIPAVTSAFFGLKFTANGMSNVYPESYRSIVRQGADFYHQFIVKDDQLVGMTMIGQTAQSALFRRALMTGQSIADILS